MNRTHDKNRIATLLGWLHRGEDLVLSILLGLTMTVAFGQIILRNFFGSSIVWADISVRILVLWLGMLGAMIATREKKHISIDLISRYLTASWQLAVDSAVSLFAAGVCATAGYYSLLFVISEFQARENAFAQVPAWLCETILPLAFFLIALRYLVQFIAGIIRLRISGWS